MTTSDHLVLIVDDREENRYTIRHALNRSGLQTIEASTGSEALEQSKLAPDVIVLDVRLPDMLGYEVCRRLRSNPRTSHIPVLQLSATFMTTESKLYALESGADAYLLQPVDPLVLVATVRSLIRLRNAEQKAQMAARQWAATFDALNEGVALVSDGIVLRCNRAMTTLLDVAYSALEGLEVEALLSKFFGVSQADIALRMSTVVHWRDRSFQLSSGPLPANDGTPGTVLVVADVTSQKQAEQALLISERLAATGRLAHTIAHEINNPLEAITNLIYLAQTSSGTDSEWKTYLASAAGEIQRISQITRQILSFNREAATPISIPISELIADVLALNARHDVNKFIRTSLEADQSLQVQGFPARLRQAFANIIRNAVDASEQGGLLHVRVSKCTMQRAGHQIPAVRISIADGGSGIPNEHREKIFDAFFTTKAQKGSGIGLWLTAAVIHEHQGKLQMRSTTHLKHQGTTFSVLLPASESPKL